MTDWIDELREDDFDGPFEPFVDVLGVRKTVELAERMGGMQFYLPKIDKLRMAAVRRLIKRDRSLGLHYRAIAIKYQVTETFVRNVCDHEARKESGGQQMRLF